MQSTKKDLSRAGKTKLNIVSSLVLQLATAIVSLVLPRLILDHFGSEANGLMQTINQFLSYTVILEFGVGGLIRASLYKPLALNDTEAISDIFNNTKKYFGRISVIFACFTIVLTLGAKAVILTGFDFMYVASMVVILALNTYFSYYFALPHRLLLRADQRLYILQNTQIITTVLNFVVCVIAMESGCNIHTVKLVSMLVFLINPVVYRIYIKKWYNISKHIFDENRYFPKKSDGMIHHAAYFIHRNTDVVIISAALGVKSASVYSVYNAVIIMLENLLNSISTAVAGAVGNMIAKDENDTLNSSFVIYDLFNTYFTAAFLTVTAMIIIPFVKIYTNGINDINYIEPLFAYLMILAGFMNCIRIPYNTVITSAGHYKETKLGAVGEVIINLTLSLLLVKPLGLAGVAAGTFAAMTFRTFYMVWYLSKNIIKRPVMKFVKSLAANLVTGVAIALMWEKFVTVNADSLAMLALYAVVASVTVFIVMAVVNALINIDVIKGLKAKKAQ